MFTLVSWTFVHVRAVSWFIVSMRFLLRGYLKQSSVSGPGSCPSLIYIIGDHNSRQIVWLQRSQCNMAKHSITTHARIDYALMFDVTLVRNKPVNMPTPRSRSRLPTEQYPEDDYPPPWPSCSSVVQRSRLPTSLAPQNKSPPGAESSSNP